jgi:hypothetical protein
MPEEFLALLREFTSCALVETANEVKERLSQTFHINCRSPLSDHANLLAHLRTPPF